MTTGGEDLAQVTLHFLAVQGPESSHLTAPLKGVLALPVWQMPCHSERE